MGSACLLPTVILVDLVDFVRYTALGRFYKRTVLCNVHVVSRSPADLTTPIFAFIALRSFSNLPFLLSWP